MSSPYFRRRCYNLVTCIPIGVLRRNGHIEDATPAVCGLLIFAITNFASAPALTVKLLVVALVSNPSEADNVNDTPLQVGTKFENVATPLDAWKRDQRLNFRFERSR